MQTHTHPARGGCACLLFVRGDIERESAPSCALGDSQGVKSLERVRPERQCRQPAPSACRSRKPAPRVGGGLASFRSERGESGGRRRGTGEHKSAANCALGDSQGVKSLERVRAEPAVTPRAQARKRRTRPRRRTRHRACEKLRAGQRQRPSPPRGEQRRSPPPQRPLPKASSVARTSLPATAAARAAQSIPKTPARRQARKLLGNRSLRGEEPSAERRLPQGRISVPFAPEGLFSFPALRAFFRQARAFSPVRAGRRKAAASSSVMVLASGAMPSKAAPRTLRRWLRSRRSSWDSFCRSTFSRFSNCRIFFFPSSTSAVHSPRVFPSVSSWLVAPFCSWAREKSSHFPGWKSPPCGFIFRCGAGGLLDKGELHQNNLRQQRCPTCDFFSHCANSFLNGVRSRIYNIRFIYPQIAKLLPHCFYQFDIRFSV